MDKKMQAKMDARRYAEAKMNYGRGAGNKRKMIQATVDERMRDPEYRAAFQEELGKINYEPIVEKVENRKKLEKGYEGVKKGMRTGRRLFRLYEQNRDIFDAILDRLGV